MCVAAPAWTMYINWTSCDYTGARPKSNRPIMNVMSCTCFPCCGKGLCSVFPMWHTVWLQEGGVCLSREVFSTNGWCCRRMARSPSVDCSCFNTTHSLLSSNIDRNVPEAQAQAHLADMLQEVLRLLDRKYSDLWTDELCSVAPTVTSDVEPP